METVKIERTTKETSVYAEISFPGKGDVSVNTTVPFFDHMLTALFFHGGFHRSMFGAARQTKPADGAFRGSLRSDG